MQDGSPRYHKIADDLRSRITKGALPPGSQLPAEIELQSQFDVSRNTVRLAIKRLIDEGLLVSSQGRGTFVRVRYEPVTLNWSTIESRARHEEAYVPGHDQWASAVADTGRTPRQEVTVSIVAPPAPIAAKFGAGSVVRRRRKRFVDDEPFMLADSYFPLNLVQGTPLMEPHDVFAPGGVLASIDLVQVRYCDELTTRMPTRVEVEELNLPAATPVTEHSRTGFDAHDRALRVMVTILPGDRHVIVYDVPAD